MNLRMNRLCVSTALAFLILAASDFRLASATSLTWDNTAATGAWNTTDANWNAGANTFNNTGVDDAIFNGAAPGTITIQAGGVLPLSVTVSSASPNNYTFQGGPIAGATSLGKSGTSTLFLRAQNTFSGGITLSQGVIDYDAPNRLGTGTVNITGNATLKNTSAGTVNITNPIVISNGVQATILSSLGSARTYSGKISGGSVGSPITLNISSDVGVFNSVSLDGANDFIGTVRLLERQRVLVNNDADFGGSANKVIGAGANAGLIFTGGLPLFTHAIEAQSFTYLGGQTTISGNLTSIGGNSFFQGGAADQLTLTGTNTHQRWVFQGGGIVTVSNPANLGSGLYGPNTGSTNSTVRFAGAATGTYTANMDIGTDDLTLDVVNASTVVTLTGNVTGSRAITSTFGLAGFVKTGAGRLDLNGTTLDFDEDTFHRVVNGTLNINSVTATNQGRFTVEANGTLGGTGNILLGQDTNAVINNVVVDGTLAPGAGGAGTFTISSSVGGGLILNPTAKLVFDLGPGSIVGSGVNDLVQVN